MFVHSNKFNIEWKGKKRIKLSESVLRKCAPFVGDPRISKHQNTQTCRVPIDEVHRKFIEIRRSRYTTISDGPLLVSRGRVIRDPSRQFRALCNANDNRLAFSRHLEICQGVPPIDEYVDRVVGPVIFNSIPSNGENVPLFVMHQRTSSRTRILRVCRNHWEIKSLARQRRSSSVTVLSY